MLSSGGESFPSSSHEVCFERSLMRERLSTKNEKVENMCPPQVLEKREAKLRVDFKHRKCQLIRRELLRPEIKENDDEQTRKKKLDVSWQTDLVFRKAVESYRCGVSDKVGFSPIHIFFFA